MGAGLTAGCVRAPRKGRHPQAGESGCVTGKRRTLMRRLSTAVDLREMRMVS